MQHAHLLRTFKVARGENYHSQQLRKRPKSSEQRGQVLCYYKAHLASERWDLLGVLKSFEIGDGEAQSVEFKTGRVGRSPLLPSHFAQLAAQAVLLEDAFYLPVLRARAVYVDQGLEVEVTSHACLLGPPLSDILLLLERAGGASCRYAAARAPRGPRVRAHVPGGL